MKQYLVPTILSSVVTVVSLSGLIFTLYRYSVLEQENKDLAEKVVETKNTQRNAREEIRDLYESQSATSDKLDVASQQLVESVQDYLLEINRTIRFIDGQGDVLPTADEERLLKQKLEVEAKINQVEFIGQEAEQQKNIVQEAVDQIYIKLEEDPNNRANPDGIR